METACLVRCGWRAATDASLAAWKGWARTHHKAAAFAVSVPSATDTLGAVRPLLRCDHDPGDPAQFGTALNDGGDGEVQLAAVTVPHDRHLDRVATSPKRQIAPPGRTVDADGAVIINRSGCSGHASMVPAELVAQPRRVAGRILIRLTRGSELSLNSDDQPACRIDLLHL